MKHSIVKIMTIAMGIILIVSLKNSVSCNDKIFIKNGSRNKKLIALTFDDGPHPKETDEVLDILKKHDVKATFFVAGKHVNWYPKPIIRAKEEGHEIGNHTFNHPDISNLSQEQLEDEIIKCENVIKGVIGVKPTLFRPPYGSYNQKTLGEIASKYKYNIVLWTTIDAKDWQNPKANKIADTIVNNVKNGDIVLLHDYATNNTVEALDILIPKMIEKGYKFVTVSEMIENS